MRPLAVLACVAIGSFASLAHAQTPHRGSDPVAARAALDAASQRAAMIDWSLDPGPVPLDEYTRRLAQLVDDAARHTQDAVAAYAAVLDHHDRDSTIRAFVAQGELYERLARAIASVPPPHARAIPPRSRPGVEDRIRQTLEQRVAPVRCFAIVRYALAVRAAVAGGVTLPEVDRARARLVEFGDPVIRPCLAAERARDPTFLPLQQGELDALAGNRR